MADWLKSDGLTVRQRLHLPPVWLLAGLVAVWGLNRTAPEAGLDHPLLKAAGLACGASGVGLILWAALHFRRARTTIVPHRTPDRLITSGPFRFSRNPIYLGDLLVLAGAVLWLGDWRGIFVVIALWVILDRQFIASEEARMKEKFGAKFRSYAAKTRRWL